MEKSLAAVPANRSTRAGLAELGEPEIEATLARVARTKDGQATEVDDETTPTAPAALAVGGSTGDGQRFRLLRPHARGGLGEVFVALDAELHREVALKQMLEKHADDPVSRQRFVAEAEITGGLEHPGIVPVYGVGTTAGGRPYYAMRFIKGESAQGGDRGISIGRRLTLPEGRPRSAAMLRWQLRRLASCGRFLDVCNAIDYAHSRGVIHRDIKPANIILGKHGETLVVDWGLAKAIGRADPSVGEQTIAPSSSGSSETLPGSALGTPAYMSPEQAAGDLDRLGPRSDVYSLGATLYCLLTGKPPFEGEDIGEILRRVQAGDVRAPREVDPSLDRPLEAVCTKAMATKPEDRYASCRALAEDVERWMADEPVTAYPEPWTRTLIRWLTRHRTGVTGVAAAVLAGVVGLAAVLAVQTRANSQLSASLTRERGPTRPGRCQRQADRRAGQGHPSPGGSPGGTPTSGDQPVSRPRRGSGCAPPRPWHGLPGTGLQPAPASAPARYTRQGQRQAPPGSRRLPGRFCRPGTDHLGRLSGTVSRSIALTPDGEKMAIALDNGTIQLRTVSTGSVVAQLNESAVDLGIDPANRWLVTAGAKGTIKVWPDYGTAAAPAAQTIEMRADLAGMARNGRFAVAYSQQKDGGVLSLWDVARQEVKARLKVPSGESVATIPGERRWPVGGSSFQRRNEALCTGVEHADP